MQILVLGMHRSGTSAVTRLVNMMGAYVGPEDKLLEISDKTMIKSNSKGHWERRDVIHVNDQILKAQGASWHQPYGNAAFNTETLVPNSVKQMQLIIYGLDTQRPWVMKDPRMCLTLPAWLPFLEMPIAIITVRSPEHIASSLQKRNQMSHEKAVSMWEYYMSQLLNATLDIPRVFVRYEHLLMRPSLTVQGLYDWLTQQGCHRLTLPAQREINAFIDPALNHANPDDAESFYNQKQQQLWHMLQGNMPQVGYISVSDDAILTLSN